MNTFFFHRLFVPCVHRVEVRKFGVCENILCACMCVCVGSFFRSHRANQQQRKKAFDLCSASYVVVLFLWFWLSVFIFVHRFFFIFILMFLLHYFYFHSSIVHPSIVLFRTYYTHTCAKCMVLCLLLPLFLLLFRFLRSFFIFNFVAEAMEFPKNINFILYSGLILIEKTNGSAKLFFFFLLLDSFIIRHIYSTHRSQTI